MSSVVSTVTVYDRVTKQSRVLPFGPDRTRAWWQEGDGSCDCSRCYEFWRDELESGELRWMDVDTGEICVSERYVVTHFNGEPVSFSEWNADYKELEPVGGLRWVKGSERKPTEEDADDGGDVHIRFLSILPAPGGRWIAATKEWNYVTDDEEWLEGAFE